MFVCFTIAHVVPPGRAGTFIADTPPEPPTSGYLWRSDADVGVARTAREMPREIPGKSVVRIGAAEDQEPERLLHAVCGRVPAAFEESLDPQQGGMLRDTGNEDDRGFR